MDFVVIPIYCGSNFRSNTPRSNFKAAEMDNAILTLCNFTEYFEGMRQFGAERIFSGPMSNFGLDDVPASWANVAGQPGFSDNEIRTIITNKFAADPGIAPSAFPGRVPVYIVIVKQGQKSSQHSGAIGWHSTLNWQGTNVLWAWVYQGSDLAGTTPTVSHEIVEAISSHLGYGERSDPCEDLPHVEMGGVKVEPYLDTFGYCVVPRTFSRAMGTPVCMSWKDADGAAVQWATISTWPGEDSTMVTKWDHPATIPNVGTSHSPAIARWNNHVYMVWKGMDNDSRIWWSRFENGVWTPQRFIWAAGTSARPALALFDGLLTCVWKGQDDDSNIYWARLKGEDWGPQQAIPGRATSHGVALLAGRSLHKFWKGADDDQTIWWSQLASGSGTWSDQVALQGWTSDTPSAALITSFVVGPDRLLLTWKGADTDTTIWQATADGTSWTEQEAVPDVATGCGPALVSDGSGRLWRAWRGAEDDTAIWWSFSDSDGRRWSPQQTIMDSIGIVPTEVYNVRTSHQPSLVMLP